MQSLFTALVIASSLSVAPDAPVRTSDDLLVASLSLDLKAVEGAAGTMPSSLLEARKLSDQLRYEEAVVEYQRYLTVPERPLKERAAALMELGFIHLVLGDAANADARAQEALDLDPKYSLPSTAPAKQLDYVEKARKAWLTRARLEPVARSDDDPPFLVRVKLTDPDHRVSRVLLRHALTSTGPYYSTEMKCDEGSCSAPIPPPKGVDSFTAWYFVEGLDGKELTVARVAGPETALQLAVVDQRAWYSSPVVWGVAGAVVVGVAAVIYFLAPQPPR